MEKRRAHADRIIVGVVRDLDDADWDRSLA
jgi:hypothetical protein